MDVALITYDSPHLKTEQIVEGLVRLEKDDTLAMYALPWKPRKQREVLFHHRPDQSEGVAPRLLCERHAIPFATVEADTEIPSGHDLYLVLGAGILSADFVTGKRILNCHPGLIPASRGLDSFKWAILDRKPLGVTLHYIDAEVDAGEVVSRVPTSVYRTDRLTTLARRHYENEIQTLTNFEDHLERPRGRDATYEEDEAKRRMPSTVEARMNDAFPAYLDRFGA